MLSERADSHPVGDADVSASPSLLAAEAPGLSAGERVRILLYLGILLLLLGFGSPGGGLIGLPISFLLKNKFHLGAHEVAVFGLLAGVPSYLSFVFGFVRDTWNPFSMGDRGFIVLFGGMCAALYLLFAFTPATYDTLLLAYLALGTSFLLVSSAQQGLTSSIGQQQLMDQRGMEHLWFSARYPRSGFGRSAQRFVRES